MSTTRSNSGNYQVVLSAKLNLDSLNSQIKQINKNPPAIKISVEISKKSLERIQQLNELLNKTQALNNYTNGIKEIKGALESYEKISSKVVTATKNLSNATADISKSSSEAAKHVKTFGEKAMEAFQKFSLWSVVSGVFYKIVRSAEQLINTVIELDSAFTELSKVTDLSRDNFDRITKQAYDLGSEVAKTTTEVINAMTEFARAGYTIGESTDVLAKNALMWTNIADGTVDASESANMLISVMKAFNIEAQNTIHIIDALNEVSNNFAVSSGQLSNSLTKSSAVLGNAGVKFEEQLGLITARNRNIKKCKHS
ncbi:MAG: phage tail tape measure protein [Methanobrevibacter sp.]|nr:phage tail tape measure protein [Methanobrevibacter sp.]